MVVCRYMRNSSIIVIKCIILRDIYILVVKNKNFLDLKIKSDSKIVIDCYNKKVNILNYIFLLMDDIWNLPQDLNIYIY